MSRSVSALGAIGTALLIAACSGGAPASGATGNSATSNGAGPIDGEPTAEAATPIAVEARIVVSRADVAGSDAQNVTATPVEGATGLEPAADEVQAAQQSAQAIAQFARIDRGAAETLVAAGLAPVALRAGQCLGPAELPSGSFSDLGEIRLLDVGEVTLRPLLDAPRTELERELAPAETAVSLAPHAFPSVSSFVSGVVYTSRDRTAGALPSGVNYEISVAGSDVLPGFLLRAQAPQQLQQVTVGGEPLAALGKVDMRAPLDATWSVGQPGDVVVLELGTTAAGSALVRCAFADEAGTGSVPLEWLAGIEGEGQVTLHRQRAQQTLLPEGVAQFPEGVVQASADAKASLIRVSFDFETSRSVEFTP